ncbi:MAG TPA: T9SS type A sorting domain-containing protein [Bacteroidia bacterium]|nr:T9SS type A sorting domain-containing protein [Bacteroidia bacterium]
MKTIYSVCVSHIVRHKIILMLLMGAMFGSQQTFASHAAGADLTYIDIGGGQYIVTYTLYRDCAGITASTTHSIQYGSVSCGVASTSVTLPLLPGYPIEITNNCAGVVSTCNGGTATGIQAYVYQDTVTLSAACVDWFFSATECCRNDAITTLDNPASNDLFIDANLNNTAGANSSPVFTNYPVAFMCIGQNNFFNHGAFDADGDSLVYSFIPARDAANTPIDYVSGYSLANPMTSTGGVTIDPVTGQITVFPTQVEVAVIAVLVLEYRNGVLIGSVVRDLQIYTTTCSNDNPVLTGFGCVNNNFFTSTCGGQVCFDICGSDPNGADSLVMSWNNGIPAATFSVTGGPNAPTGHFCWTPTPADARPTPYQFTVTVRDNACPANGSTTRAFSVLVSNLSVSVTNTPSVACNGAHTGTASASLVGGVGTIQYAWSGPNGFTATSASVNRLYAGQYSVDVTDSTGCMGTRYFTITEPPALNLNITKQDAGCGGTFGTATANVTGGTGTPTYLWSPTGGTAMTAPNLLPGQYSVLVKDANNCSVSGNVTIDGGPMMTASMSTTGATCLANDGSATVSVTGGTAPITYAWSPNVSTTNSATGLITGSYDCVVTDALGCSIPLSGIVPNLAGISATITGSTDATCETSDDGTASVMASGGTMPYTYLWPNGDTTASVNNLAPGTYVVQVEDYHGCRAYASVTIGFTNPSPVIDLGPDTVMCIGSTLVLDAGAGFSSYLWSDNSTSQTLAVTTAGTYSVLVTNSMGCENFDAIMVSFIQCPAIQTNNHIQYGNWQAFTVSPNPFRDQVTVNIAKIKDANVRILVLDVLGNQLYNSNEKSQYGYTKTIDLHQYSAGIYLMRIEYNGELKTIRLVKE